MTSTSISAGSGTTSAASGGGAGGSGGAGTCNLVQGVGQCPPSPPMTGTPCTPIAACVYQCMQCNCAAGTWGCQ
jgi:hypothetical protein